MANMLIQLLLLVRQCESTTIEDLFDTLNRFRISVPFVSASNESIDFILDQAYTLLNHVVLDAVYALSVCDMIYGLNAAIDVMVVVFKRTDQKRNTIQCIEAMIEHHRREADSLMNTVDGLVLEIRQVIPKLYQVIRDYNQLNANNISGEPVSAGIYERLSLIADAALDHASSRTFNHNFYVDWAAKMEKEVRDMFPNLSDEEESIIQECLKDSLSKRDTTISQVMEVLRAEQDSDNDEFANTIDLIYSGFTEQRVD